MGHCSKAPLCTVDTVLSPSLSSSRAESPSRAPLPTDLMALRRSESSLSRGREEKGARASSTV